MTHALDSACSQAPSGLKWQSVGPSRPAHGRELNSPGMADALVGSLGHKDQGACRPGHKGQTEARFTDKEWQAFGIRDLGYDDFIKAGPLYYKCTSIRSAFQVCPNPCGLGFRV